jgi:hypothetical protein
MSERTDPCNQCGAFEFYQKGKFSYCKPCHLEAVKRYTQRKRQGISIDTKPAPPITIGNLLDLPNHHERAKKVCPKGHAYSGDNVRVTSQKNGKNVNRKCRACERNAKRISYGLAPEPAPIKLSQLLDAEG